MKVACIAAVAAGSFMAACGGSGASTQSGQSGAGAPAGSSSAASAGAPSQTDLTVSGVLTGRTTNGQADGVFCGPSSADTTTGHWDFVATVNGTDYGFSLSMTGYHGPGTYSLGLNDPGNFSIGTRKSLGGGAVETDPAFAAVSGSVVIDSSEKGGSLDAALSAGGDLTSDSTASGHIKGVWNCAGQPGGG